MRKHILFTLFAISAVLVMVSCPGPGPSPNPSSSASVVVTYKTSSKASTDSVSTVTVGLSSDNVTDEVFSTICEKQEIGGVNNIVALSFSKVKKITGVFSNGVINESLKNITFDSSLSLLSSDSFYYARGLEKVKINSVPEIEERAFYEGTQTRIESDNQIPTSQMKEYISYFNNIRLGVKIKFVDSKAGDSTKTFYINEAPSKLTVPESSLRTRFEGYYTEKDGNGEKIFNSEGNVIKNTKCADDNGVWKSVDTATLYAYYSQDFYMVRFDPGAGSGKMDDQVINVGQTAVLNKCTFEGPLLNTFKEWETSSTTVKKYKDMATVQDIAKKGDIITLVAIWESGKYTRTYYRNFDANDDTVLGTEVLQNDTTITDRVTGNISNPSYSGKTFLGWFTDRECTVPFNPDIESNYDISVYAKWQHGIANYTIKFDSNCEAGPGTLKRNVLGELRPQDVGKIYSISADGGWTTFTALPDLVVNTSEGIKFSKVPVTWKIYDGGVFLGWSTNKNASVATFKASSFSTTGAGIVEDFKGHAAFEAGLLGDGSEVTLYAIWRESAGSSSGGSIAPNMEQNVKLHMYTASTNGKVYYKSNPKETYNESLKLTFTGATPIYDSMQGGEDITNKSYYDELEKVNFFFKDKDGNTDYYLAGFYNEEVGGVKVLNADGSFYNVDVLSKEQDNGYVYKNYEGRFVWIGGTVTSNGPEEYTHLYAHWEKNK